MNNIYKNTIYDSLFLWDNVDENGNEKMYCSELVFHILKRSLGKKLKLTPKNMHFHNQLEFWNRYYQGKIPTGELGLSPADYVKSKDFSILEKTPVSSDGDVHRLRERVRGRVLLP